MKADLPIEWLCGPVVVLLAWLVYEALRFWRGDKRVGWCVAGWTLRPWAVWALFNLIHRANIHKGFGEARSFPRYHEETFPFFARPWHLGESLAEAVARLATTPTVWFWLAVVLGLSAVVLFLVVRSQADTPKSHFGKVGLLVGLFVLAGCLHLSVGSLPNGARSTEEREGSLLSCWHAHHTMLYAIPYVKSKSHFLRYYHDKQPKLRTTIHALSHPPGAPLSLFWLGKLAGAGDMDVREDSTRIRYAVALVFFGALNVFVLFAMGRSFFGQDKYGYGAAALWLTAPSVTAYSNFAQDTLFAVFFNMALLLIWKVGTAKERSYSAMVGLGFVFHCLNFLNYSWCLVTTLFALFLVYNGRRQRWSFRELALRGVVPLGLMTVLSASVLARYKINYLRIYRVASDYVSEWYQFETVYQHVMGWIGGQIDVFLLLGGMTCSAFFITLFTRVRREWPSPQPVFLAMILGVYVLPILFGPNCVRMETARCWSWVMSVPVCFAAKEMLARPHGSRLIAWAAATAIGTYTLMRLFVTVSP